MAIDEKLEILAIGTKDGRIIMLVNSHGSGISSIYYAILLKKKNF